MSKRKFLYSAKYRREVMFQRPFKGFCKRRNSQVKMQVDFPSKGQIESLKNVVDAAGNKITWRKCIDRLRHRS